MGASHLGKKIKRETSSKLFGDIHWRLPKKEML